MKASNEQSQRYKQLVKKQVPPTPLARNVLLAFLVGGTICAIGQVAMFGFMALGMSQQTAPSPAAAVMIGVGALLTGLGVYDEIGRYGGMGAALPITGFANAIVAPAMEYKREGYVLGVAARMFTVAGPVLVYGLLTATVLATLAYLAGVRVE